MKIWIIIYMIFSAVFALAVLAYVAIDLILSRKKEEPEPEPEVAPEPLEEAAPIIIIPEPEPEPEPIPVVIPFVFPEPVDHIEAAEADELVPDEVAIATAITEEGAGTGYRHYINLGVIDRNFEAGDVVTLAALKEKKLMAKKVGRIKILADGILTKPLTVKAESYSVEAMKMIELTGGTVVILK